jgi:hypothetical protein
LNVQFDKPLLQPFVFIHKQQAAEKFMYELFTARPTGELINNADRDLIASLCRKGEVKGAFL